MALQKSVTLPNTTVATYWKVKNITLDYITKTAYVIVLGYASKDARENAPESSIMQKRFVVQLTDTSIDVRPQVYELLKSSKGPFEAEAFLDGATDC